MTTQVRVGPWQMMLPEMGNPAHAISLYAKEKLEEVDDVVRTYPMLQAAVVFTCALVIVFSVIRLWKSCTS
jgi:hypothetical protein